MGPVERLQAAINELERLKTMSTRGPWSHLWGRDYSTVENETEYGVRPIAMFGVRPEDAELTVTLYRTIDAQLAVLRDAHERYSHNPEKEPVSPSGKNAVALADAILNQPSEE